MCMCFFFGGGGGNGGSGHCKSLEVGNMPYTVMYVWEQYNNIEQL